MTWFTQTLAFKKKQVNYEMHVTGKIFGFRDVMSRWKRGTSSKHSQGFFSEDELLLLEYVWTRQTQLLPPDLRSVISSQVCSKEHYAAGVPFLQRWRRLTFAFQVSTEDGVLVFCTVTLESKSILCKQDNCPIFEMLSVHPEHRRGTLTAPITTTFSWAALKALRRQLHLQKSNAEILPPDNQKIDTTAVWSGPCLNSELLF